MTRAVWPGEPFPLGPDWDGEGTNFALFSENAERVELCLYDEHGTEERIDLHEQRPAEIAGMAREAAKHFIQKQRGNIVNISSTAGLRGAANGTRNKCST